MTTVKHPGARPGVHTSADRDKRGFPVGTSSFAGCGQTLSVEERAALARAKNKSRSARGHHVKAYCR